MKLRTVISHIYNEAYMLPWWIKHHYEMFDYGIFLDYSSSDETADICRSLAPNWRFLRSRNPMFEGWAADFEIMSYEEELPGWKMSLNTTEFLCGVDLDRTDDYLVQKNANGCIFDYFVMADPFPNELPTYDKSLIDQKYWGYHEELEENHFERHSRLYHRSHNGGYLPGRHGTFLPHVEHAYDQGAILWYKYSPWNDAFLSRKLQIQTKIPTQDREQNLGHHHIVTDRQLLNQHAQAVARSVDLRPVLENYPGPIIMPEMPAPLKLRAVG